MRVYELAKEAGVTSAAVLKAAEAAELDASSAISVLDDDDVKVLREAVAKLDGKGAESVRSAKRARAGELKKKSVDADRATLDRHLKTAKDAAEGKKVDTAVKVVAPVEQAAAKPEPA